MLAIFYYRFFVNYSNRYQTSQCEHSRTMEACIKYIETGDPIWYNGRCISGSARRPNVIPSQKRQDFWEKWSELQSIAERD